MRSAGRYQGVTGEKAGGETYTPKRLADFVAEHICTLAQPAHRAAPVRLLDPAVGDGELLMSLLERLERYGVAAPVVHGFETDRAALNTARQRIERRFPQAVLDMVPENFLQFAVERMRRNGRGGLRERPQPPAYDLIIANPPYVRTQILGAERVRLLKHQFRLAGRVDLYFAFIVGMAHVMKPGAVAGLIVSNRFMTTQSGRAVRQAIGTYFKVRHVWDLGDTRLFDAAVLPAVLLVERREMAPPESAAINSASAGVTAESARATPDLTGNNCEPAAFTSIYSSSAEATRSDRDVISALGADGVVAIDDGRRFTVRQGTLTVAATANSVWRIADAQSDAWLATVESNAWRRFKDIGRIRVGVKTCADTVFIRTDWDEMPDSMRPELLRPLTTHHVARRFRPIANGKKKWQILYPHETVNGRRRAVDLSSYPRSAAYLARHRQLLAARGYVSEARRQWYEIWVPQEPSAWASPKLVFRDISEQPTFWLDLQGSVVNGDCYWLAATRADDNELLWLAAAVANSSFIETFYDRQFNNKLYAGRRRFMTQYVETFPLPDPTLSVSREIIALSKTRYESTDSGGVADPANILDRLIWAAFGVATSR
jgi:hypothetical protein